MTNNSFNCTIPSQSQIGTLSVTLSMVKNGNSEIDSPVYARATNSTANTYSFSRCSDYSTGFKCQSILSELTDCGWCNSTATCTASTGCVGTNFTRTLFPSFDGFRPNVVASNSSVDFVVSGTNFAASSGVKYTLHFIRSSRSIPEDEPTGDGLSFAVKTLNRTLIRFEGVIKTEGIYYPVLYANKKVVGNNEVPDSVRSINCSDIGNCSDCRRVSVCKWCRDTCVAKSSSSVSPCIQSSCQEGLPSLSGSGADVHGDLDANVTFWYPMNTESSYFISFKKSSKRQVQNDSSIPLLFDSTNQTAFFTIPASQFVPGSYQPTIQGDNYISNTSQTFTFVDCEGETNCQACKDDSQCIWTNSNGNLKCVGRQLNPAASSIICLDFTDEETSVNQNSSIISGLPTSNRETFAIAENPSVQSTPIIPIIVGAVVGGVLLLVILVLLAILILKRKKKDDVPLLNPPEDFEMVIISRDAEPTFNVTKNQMNNMKGLEDELLRDGFPHADNLNGVPGAGEMESFGKFYIYLAFSKDRFTARDLLQRYLRIEVDKTKQETTLFRTTSNSTQMYTVYAKVLGLEFLWNTLASPIHQIIRAGEQEMLRSEANGNSSVNRHQNTNLTSFIGLEIDSDSHEEDPEFMEANMYQLLSILSKIFARIRKNIPFLSPWIRLAIRDTRAYVSKRFPSSDSKVVGSFLFLRYIVPAITSPQLYGITHNPPNAHAQRILILVSRVMQNLANETLPSTKTEALQKMDQFVADNIPILHTMYDGITNYHPTEEDLQGGSALNLPDGCYENSIVWLHNCLLRNKNKMSATTLESIGPHILPNEISKR
eukprot:TRINITY_DN1411_c0_g1_i3.p1 TRINITY_DN1411_c0_g1~~TRINITY_DN1411_c0_g1_i3.p1  ORF type:complete len:924 (-),score=229.21 TRINITY_DN1411_c0_g1_i3:97-2574(-)